VKKLLGIIYGFVYGASLIIPGLSGSTFLVIFGCYDKVCAAFALDFKAIKEHFTFYIVFGLGAVAGLVGSIFAITELIERFHWSNLIFAALILIGLPAIIKSADGEGAENSSVKFKPLCIIPFVLGAAAIVAVSLSEMFLEGGSDSVGVIGLVVYSSIAAAAMLIPGISGAFMLMAFGIYEPVMGALRALDFSIIIPAVIGIVLGLVLGAKLITFLLKKFRLMVYSALIGMVIASVVMLVVSTFM